MNRQQADAFFDKLEEGLRENFTIPKRKLSESEKKTDKLTSGDSSPVKKEGSISGSGSDGEGKKKASSSGYDRKPPGYKEPSEKRPRYSAGSDTSRKPFRKSDPLGLDTVRMSYGEAEERGLAGDTSGLKAWQDMYDAPLPTELLKKCRIAKCDLCDIEFTSAIVAKSHYVGKNHSKKTNLFLSDFALNHPEQKVPVRVNQAFDKPPEPDQPVTVIAGLTQNQDETFCHLCNIGLSSKIVAVTHYRGKKHLNNVKNSKSINPRPPKGGGMTDPTGGFGIGVAFHKKTTPPEDGVSVEPSGRTTPVADEPLEEGEVVDEGWTPAPGSVLASCSGAFAASSSSYSSESRRYFCLPCKLYFGDTVEYSAHIVSADHKTNAFSQMGNTEERQFYCSVCMAQCASQSAYDAHLKNASHQKKVKAASGTSLDSFMSQIRADPTSVYWCKVCTLQCTGPKDYEAHCAGKKHRSKAALGSGQHIPPAGGAAQPPQQPPSQFRCDICQITTTDQAGLDMHLAGKKHKKKAGQQ